MQPPRQVCLMATPRFACCCLPAPPSCIDGAQRNAHMREPLQLPPSTFTCSPACSLSHPSRLCVALVVSLPSPAAPFQHRRLRGWLLHADGVSGKTRSELRGAEHLDLGLPVLARVSEGMPEGARRRHLDRDTLHGAVLCSLVLPSGFVNVREMGSSRTGRIVRPILCRSCLVWGGVCGGRVWHGAQALSNGWCVRARPIACINAECVRSR